MSYASPALLEQHECSCGNGSHLHLLAKRVLRYDPSRTGAIRTGFTRDLDRRFALVKAAIRHAIVDLDVMGLGKEKKPTQLKIQAGIPLNKYEFAYDNSATGIRRFIRWLNDEIDDKVLKIVKGPQLQGTATGWTDVYIDSAYKKGMQRGETELNKKGIKFPKSDFAPRFIDSAFNMPFHVDRVALLHMRTYDDLKGITQFLSNRIAHTLAEGMAKGLSPLEMARSLSEETDIGRSRARTIARTEIIRAHHMASMGMYRAAQIEGVEVEAEWSTAGDDKVCTKCQALEGKVFSIDDIEGRIPLHPNCIVDGQIPIFTSDGWVKIKDVKVGNLVLTHKGRFRAVTRVHHTKAVKGQRCVRFGTERWSRYWTHLSVTDNHPILTDRGWIQAKDLVVGDIAYVLASTCRTCGKRIPWRMTYCSRTCASSYNMTQQWKTEAMREAVSTKVSASLKEQYLDGRRDRFTIGIEARKVMAEKAVRGEHPLQDPEVHKKANQSLARNHKTSWLQRKLGWGLHHVGLNPEEGYAIPTKREDKRKSYLFPDFAFPKVKLAVEADGKHWHTKKGTEERDALLEKSGWDVIHLTEKEINKSCLKAAKRVKRLLLNHTKQYRFKKVRITSVRKFSLVQAKRVYNLTVAEDESYLAWGWIVHNCRCVAIPANVGEKRSKLKLFSRLSVFGGKGSGAFGHKGRPGQVGGGSMVGGSGEEDAYKAAVDLIKMPKYLYHVTDRKNISSIESGGLRKSKRSTTEGQSRGVYLTDNPQEFFSMGDAGFSPEDAMVVKVEMSKVSRRHLSLDPEYDPSGGGDDASTMAKEANLTGIYLFSTKPISKKAIVSVTSYSQQVRRRTR